MNIFRRFPVPSCAFALLAVGALFLAGCVTTGEVERIVHDSNYQVLVASTPDAALGGVPADGKVNAAALDASARVNAFLETHKSDPVLAGALRFRQALLHLGRHEFALADAAIAQVTAGSLRSPRDQAIFAAYADLRWWSEHAESSQATFFANQREASAQHLQSLRRHADGLAALPDLRDYFLELRAWIGLKLGLASRDLAFSARTLQDAVDVWTATFSPAELQLSPSSDPRGPKPFDLSTRRVLRVRALLEKLAAETTGLSELRLTFAQPAVNKFYATLPH